MKLRGEDYANFYKYKEKRNTKLRLRRYIKRYRREYKEELLSIITEPGGSYRERLLKRMGVVKNLALRDSKAYLNRNFEILKKIKRISMKW
jgi:hypothetical protein